MIWRCLQSQHAWPSRGRLSLRGRSDDLRNQCVERVRTLPHEVRVLERPLQVDVSSHGGEGVTQQVGTDLCWRSSCFVGMCECEELCTARLEQSMGVGGDKERKEEEEEVEVEVVVTVVVVVMIIVQVAWRWSQRCCL